MIRQMSETVLFKHLKFQGSSIEAGRLARLRNVNDGLAAHVETLEVATSEARDFTGVLENLVGLRVLNWSIHDHIPLHILEFLNTCPRIRLHLAPGHSRPDVAPLDKDALASPLLHTLDYIIYGQLFTANKPSEFASFKKCVLQAGGLRDLTIDVKDYGIYNLNTRHCEMWVQCMDWSQLRSLDLGHTSPQYLLPALTGRVSGLVSLCFSFWPNHRDPWAPWANPANLDIVRHFLESINALHVVTLDTDCDAECSSKTRPSLLPKYGPSLRKLSVWLRMGGSWCLSHFEELEKYAPRLEELDVPAELLQERKPRGEYHIIAREVVSQVPGMRGLRQDLSRPSSRCLRRLTLRIALRYDSVEFVPDARPGADCAINDDMARQRALHLWNSLRAIEKLSVVFRAEVVTGEVEVQHCGREECQRRGVGGKEAAGTFDPFA
ncbi:hypothetical protein DE146DRAFT_627711 [Phaeosphaeria sp. MPI-PUGE-AT-0046c]|nr:hypothetical protein DE146DRAFT_627711 [Phaeosphaeria sp. MPI-PUGE-AT-0046c]